MARGFDSKDVEAQIEQREADRRARAALAAHTAAGLDRDAKRESLLLSRRRVELDLESAKHPRHRTQLEAALAFVNAQLVELERNHLAASSRSVV